ncbi:MAG: alpha/beta fold hydrolase [Patescibacteria group bacterium]
MIEKRIEFKNSKGKRLVGVLHVPDAKRKHPAVIICHGFKRTKDQIIPLVLSRNLSVEGFVVLRFDFSNWGESEGVYSKMKFTQQIEDVDSAIKYLAKQRFVDNKRIGLAGLSLGGGVALVSAANNPNKVKTVVAFAPSLDFFNIIRKSFNKKGQLEGWKRKGYSYMYDQGRDTYWKFDYSFYKDAQAVVKPFDYYDKIQCPVFIIQGDKDSAVSLADNRKFYHKLRAIKKLFIVPDGDHQFRKIKSLNSSIVAATKWFKKYL